MNKEYLGDAVYACFDPLTGDLVLTTEDGMSATNRIVLEQAVIDSLKEYLSRNER